MLQIEALTKGAKINDSYNPWVCLTYQSLVVVIVFGSVNLILYYFLLLKHSYLLNVEMFCGSNHGAWVWGTMSPRLINQVQEDRFAIFILKADKVFN